MARLDIRNGTLLNSGTLSPNPWDLTLSGQNICWRYTEGTRTEDKAPQGCDLSADSSAGITRDGFDAEAVSVQNQTRRILAYCRPKMVLTKGSTLPRAKSREKIGNRLGPFLNYEIQSLVTYRHTHMRIR